MDVGACLMYENQREGGGGREGEREGERAIETMPKGIDPTLENFMDVVLGCKQLRDLSLLINFVNFSTGSCISVVVSDIVIGRRGPPIYSGNYASIYPIHFHTHTLTHTRTLTLTHMHAHTQRVTS